MRNAIMNLSHETEYWFLTTKQKLVIHKHRLQVVIDVHVFLQTILILEVSSGCPGLPLSRSPLVLRTAASLKKDPVGYTDRHVRQRQPKLHFQPYLRPSAASSFGFKVPSTGA